MPRSPAALLFRFVFLTWHLLAVLRQSACRVVDWPDNAGKNSCLYSFASAGSRCRIYRFDMRVCPPCKGSGMMTLFFTCLFCAHSATAFGSICVNHPRCRCCHPHVCFRRCWCGEFPTDRPTGRCLRQVCMSRQHCCSATFFVCLMTA